MNARRGPRGRAGAFALSLTLVLGATACGSDGDASDGAAPIPTVPAGAETSSTTTDGGHGSPVVTVGAVDFAFEDLPAAIEAGTRLELVNKAPTELHELVAFRLPDDEERPANELVRLAPEDLASVIGGPPALVILAPPGEAEPVVAVGDGTLAESGRYLVLCSIPTGVDPDEYLAAAAAAGGEQPQVEGGPPHLAHGMVAEVIVG